MAGREGLGQKVRRRHDYILHGEFIIGIRQCGNDLKQIALPAKKVENMHTQLRCLSPTTTSFVSIRHSASPRRWRQACRIGFARFLISKRCWKLAGQSPASGDLTRKNLGRSRCLIHKEIFIKTRSIR